MSGQKNEPIAIIGSGCRFPGGSSSPCSLWRLLREPREVASKIERFTNAAFYHPDGSHHGTTNVKESYFLTEDHRHFDAQFFNIQPAEAESIDPQQRLLLETVYEALEASGQTIESLQGSMTAVYVGLMNGDYSDVLFRDLDSLPTYTATAVARSIVSNRVSYFFDWRGPSMTIDTACSSSLVALHQGVQALRSGDTRMAIAAGTNLILGPELYIAESKLNMLSPSGRSRMWDQGADGYARGEGVAAIVLKKLSDAIKDGDHVESVIREICINQDGRTRGITMPSQKAQEELIRHTYAKAGLDPQNPLERCQYFEAHGTGTKAGDPVEAEAVSRAFFGPEYRGPMDETLYVGSIKTVIGHTEGTAGLAGVMKVSLGLQNQLIPPNLHFNRISPDVNPFCDHLRIPRSATPWPNSPPGLPRRASVNSFGFGGTNAHAILESYDNSRLSDRKSTSDPHPVVTPFVFSAASERSLAALLERYSTFLKMNESINLRDLAWTLHSRRSAFPFKAAFSATSASSLYSSIDAKLNALACQAINTVGTHNPTKKPRILGVFTGQGAQWATMGREIGLQSQYARQTLERLELSLSQLPPADRPSWSLWQELLAKPETSRISEARLSQPLCTAIQIVLVDILQASGVELNAVVGHSSGEIAAAYAAGYLTAHDAIRIAYYRGLYAEMARGVGGCRGAMLAVGTSPEDAADLCGMPNFENRIWLAACNSPASVTLSGDADAVEEAREILTEEKKFARVLKVDTAYHSKHMDPCSIIYAQSLEACQVTPTIPGTKAPLWFSSVHNGLNMQDCGTYALMAGYWKENMLQTVQFSQAVESALHEAGPFDATIELGPHPALKGPVSQIVSGKSGPSVPHIGSLNRGDSDLGSLSGALGLLWQNFGTSVVNFGHYDHLMTNCPQPRLLKNLPSYTWDHERAFWWESRTSKLIRSRETESHELLGTRCPDGTKEELRWRNSLKPREVPWLKQHQLQGQTVFPAAAYVAMALESAETMSLGHQLKLLEVHDLVIGKAITFDDDNSTVDTLFTLTNIALKSDNEDNMTADFKCFSCISQEAGSMGLNASGHLRLVLGEPSTALLPHRPTPVLNTVPVDTESFYAALSELGYGYSESFRGLSGLKRKMDVATGYISLPLTEERDETFLLHPATLDMAFQAVFVGYSFPGDGRLGSLHVPTSIRSIKVNPCLCKQAVADSRKLPFDSTMTQMRSSSVRGDVVLYTNNAFEHGALLQVEEVTVVPFIAPGPADDTQLYSETKWDVIAPDGELVVDDERASPEESRIGEILERISFYYLRSLYESTTEQVIAGLEWHHRSLLHFARHIVDQVSTGSHAFAKSEWRNDTYDLIMNLIGCYPARDDVKLIHAVGENLPAVFRGQTTILEHMTRDNLLDDFYRTGLGFPQANEYIARMAWQIAYANPHMKILEIGAGTGGATKRILRKVGHAFSAYTYTDISAGFFEKAREVFGDFESRMMFKTLDVEKDIETQGYIEHSYDLIVASNVLHATRNLEHTMGNVRSLLKPGGYLLLLETTNDGPMRIGFVMGGLPGWWVGADDGRPLAPTISLVQWDTLLRKTGFSGVDTITPNHDPLPFPFFVLASQAMDVRTNLIRQPLLASNEDVQISELTIIGGQKLEIAKLAQGVRRLLHPLCLKVLTYIGLDDTTNIGTMSAGSTTLCLTDLDEPVFKSMIRESMDGIRRIFDQSRNILWVTQGCRQEQPYMNMSVGLGRSLCYEYPDTRVQYLDLEFDKKHDAQVVAEALLRLQMQESWNQDSFANQSFKSYEPELAIQDGRFMAPRILPNQSQNDRYNSSRRLITIDLSPQKCSLTIAPQAQFFCLQRSTTSVQKSAVPTKTVQVTHSLLCSVKIADLGFFYLLVGFTLGEGQKVVALSETNASVVQLTDDWLLPYTVPLGQEARFLLTVAYQVMTEALIAMTPSNGTLLLHEPDEVLGSMLMKHGMKSGVHVTLTTGDQIYDNSQWVQIHPNASRYDTKSKLPKNVSLFVDLSADRTPESLGNRIISCLESFCRSENRDSIVRNVSMANAEAIAHPVDRLRNVLDSLNRSDGPDFVPSNVPEILTAKDISNGAQGKTLAPVVDWIQHPTVPVKIDPVDFGYNLSNAKTYLLIGLTGQLGQSLCEWMLSHGAKHIVLTSRNPQIDSRWLDELGRKGATVKIKSLDITNEVRLRQVHDDICINMPPIAGVVNGAMVLEDTMFANMDVELMHKVLRPKVDGTIHLDELFPDNTLDFFILLSSVACVMGNRGQSNYTAANMFMTSLARQRRHRGLAASVIDISGIVGIGYISRVGQEVRDSIQKTGAMAISEQDFHQMFAEAVIAGAPLSGNNPEIITGLGTVHSDDEFQVPWLDNPRFSHLVIKQRTVKTDNAAKKASIPTRSQLMAVESKQEAYHVMERCFTTKVQLTLQLPAEESINTQAALIELGVDSLVAVEVRTWFLKELGLDMPVLKILGGASIDDLLQDALARLPAEMLPKINIEGAETEEDTKSKSISTHDPVRDSGTSSSVASLTPEETSSDAIMSTSSVSSYDPRDSGNHDAPKEMIFLRQVPMSYGQSRFWFLKSYLRDQSAFNVVLSARVSGKVRIADLERAVHAVGERHESLRTCFFYDVETGTPMQGILESSHLHLEHKHIGCEGDFIEEFKRMENHQFELDSGGTMRILLLSLSSDLHYLIIACHHIIMDEVSLRILFSDLEKVYSGRSLQGPMVQYPEYSIRQKRSIEMGVLDDDKAFWRTQFPDFPTPLPLFPFRENNVRPLITRYEFNKFEAKVDARVVEKIKDVCRRSKTTNFHFYLALLRVLLYRFLNSNDLCIGIADANRTESDVMASIGFFVNLLPLRFRTESGQTFRAILQDVRSRTFEALAHSRVPFDFILDDFGAPRSATHSPVFQAFIDYRLGVKEKDSFAECELQRDKYVFGRTAYDLSLDIIENAGGETFLMLMLQKELYTSEHSELLMNCYLQLLESFSRDADQALEKPSLFDEQSISKALAAGAGPVVQSDWPDTLVHRVDEMVKLRSAEEAIKDGSGIGITYAEMRRRTNSIAAVLVSSGICKGSVVAVFQEPAADWICSLLAILHIGAIYVPLDQRIPMTRLATIVQDCRASAILTHTATKHDADGLSALPTIVFNVSDLGDTNEEPITISAEARDPAVILYTSGTTGTPKGIILTHANLQNELEAFTKSYSVGVERVLQQSALSFDFSLEQIFAAIANGGTLYVVPKTSRGDPVKVVELIAAEGITLTEATPSEYHSWINYGSPQLLANSELKIAVSGGEQLPYRLARQMKALGKPALRILNIYGPTEVTISSNKTEIALTDIQGVSTSEARIAVGRTLPNCSVYILDETQKPLPIGIPGEVFVGGAGIASGYLNNDELTRRNFLPDLFAPQDFVRKGWRTMYRTGDLGLLDADGSLTILGRKHGDNQIKLRGIRIELEDIENAILSTSDGVLLDAVVTTRGNQQLLVAHVVFSPNYPMAKRRGFLQSLPSLLPLPQYMWPNMTLALDSMPLNAHLKTDRRAIASLALPERSTLIDEDDQLTVEEERLRTVWTHILPHKGSGRSAITRQEDFFLAGGNSLLLMQMQSTIRESFGVSLSLIQLFQASKLEQMAAIIRDQKAMMTPAVDWEQETLINPVPVTNFKSPPPALQPKMVILTGSTGFLGKTILHILQNSKQIEKIHCIAVRGNDVSARFHNSRKVIVHNGDLTLPRLGLGEAEALAIFNECDAIVHNGAEVSFMKTFQGLKSANLDSTKELVQLALPRRIPLHFVSTVGVGRFVDGDTLSEVSVASSVPPTDGLAGYAATKWASERILERVQDQFGLDVFIHRPSSITGDGAPERDIMANLLRYSRSLGAVPVSSSWEGYADFVQVDNVGRGIVEHVLAGREGGRTESAGSVSYIHHCGDQVVPLDKMDRVVQERGESGSIKRIPVKKWIRSAREQGMDELVAMFLDSLASAKEPMVFRRLVKGKGPSGVNAGQ